MKINDTITASPGPGLGTEPGASGARALSATTRRRQRRRKRVRSSFNWKFGRPAKQKEFESGARHRVSLPPINASKTQRHNDECVIGGRATIGELCSDW